MRGSSRERNGSRQGERESLEERYRYLVFRMLRALMVAILIYLAFLVALEGARMTFMQATSLLLLLWAVLVAIALARVRAGRIGQAVWLVVSGVLLVLGVETVQSGVVSPADPYLFAYSVPIAFAALLAGRTALLTAVLISVSIVTAVYVGERAGVPWIGRDPGDDDISVLLVFILVMGLLALVLERFGVEIRRAHLDLEHRERQQSELVRSLEREIEERKLAEQERKELLEREREARQRAEALVAENQRLLSEIRGLNEELERRVEERTRELSEALGELETFTHSAAHDLRTPLRGIDGFCQVLLEDYGDRLDDSALYYVGRIRHGAKRLGDLIDDLLLLSHVSRRPVNEERLDLTAIAQDVVRRLRREHPDDFVSVDIEPGMTSVGDVRLTYSVLENLIGNAWKFSSQGDDPRIAIGSEELRGERAFFVRDNGIGFDPTYRDKLFAPFQRLHVTPEYEGSGIGLAIVDRAVRKQGGRVWALSRLGEGATFYFTLGE